jgi:hypothetical protein
MGDKVLMVNPGFINPMSDAGELEITGRSAGRIALGPGLGSHDEPMHCMRTKSGKITEVKIAGTRFMSADKVAREMEARYDKVKSGNRRGAR